MIFVKKLAQQVRTEELSKSTYLGGPVKISGYQEANASGFYNKVGFVDFNKESVEDNQINLTPALINHLKKIEENYRFFVAHVLIDSSQDVYNRTNPSGQYLGLPLREPDHFASFVLSFSVLIRISP
jgi:hypothetical protein